VRRNCVHRSISEKGSWPVLDLTPFVLHDKQLWSQRYSACWCWRQEKMAHHWSIAQRRQRRRVRSRCSTFWEATFVELLGCHRPPAIHMRAHGGSKRAGFPPVGAEVCRVIAHTRIRTLTDSLHAGMAASCVTAQW
jgi:hypothetical protein